MLFLRNDFFENFRGHFYDDVIYRENSYLWSNEEDKIKLKTGAEVGDILLLFGWIMFSRKLLKLKGIHESPPTAWEFRDNVNV